MKQFLDADEEETPVPARSLRARFKRALLKFTFAGALLFLFIYQLPFLKDRILLSDHHTVNVYNGKNLFFPDNSFFRIKGDARRLTVEEIGVDSYVTYPQRGDQIPLQMEYPTCQMVKHGKKIILVSTYPPVRAEGFEENVAYDVIKPVPDLSPFYYFMAFVAYPSYIFKSKEELSGKKFFYTEKTSWQEFLHDWKYVSTFNDGDKVKVFTLQAKSNENAVVCNF